MTTRTRTFCPPSRKNFWPTTFVIMEKNPENMPWLRARVCTATGNKINYYFGFNLYILQDFLIGILKLRVFVVIIMSCFSPVLFSFVFYVLVCKPIQSFLPQSTRSHFSFFLYKYYSYLHLFPKPISANLLSSNYK